MRILVCGGRNFTNAHKMWSTLDAIDAKARIGTVIDGASDELIGPHLGADYWGHQWALARDRTTMRFSADWKTEGRAAGPIRNQRMLDDGKPDLVVAFEGGRGTADMVRRAKSAGVRVYEPH